MFILLRDIWVTKMIVDKVLNVPLINEFGTFFVGAYQILNNQKIDEAMVLYCGSISEIKNVRINSACYTGDLFHCSRCDCNYQLNSSMNYIARNKGLIIYLLGQDGRGCGTVNKLKSLLLMDEKRISTKKAFEELGIKVDARDYSIAIAILNDLNINNINLITNNPEKIQYLENEGIHVVKRIPIISSNPKIRDYLISKEKDFGHLIGFN